jgi:hypothetical protein
MASVASAVRTKITDASLTNVGTKVYRDFAPDEIALPFVTFISDVARVSILEGDGIVKARQQTMAVDLWQSLTDESVGLIEELLTALDGVALTGVDKTVFNCKVTDVSRLVELDTDICHHSVTLDVVHSN